MVLVGRRCAGGGSAGNGPGGGNADFGMRHAKTGEQRSAGGAADESGQRPDGIGVRVLPAEF